MYVKTVNIIKMNVIDIDRYNISDRCSKSIAGQPVRQRSRINRRRRACDHVLSSSVEARAGANCEYDTSTTRDVCSIRKRERTARREGRRAIRKVGRSAWLTVREEETNLNRATELPRLSRTRP